MKKKWIAIIGSVLVIGLTIAGTSFAASDEAGILNGTIRVANQSEVKFPSMARISMNQAVQKALAAAQGQVLNTELEEENGFLVYGVEVISSDKAIVDVKVDAGSGKVLAMDKDTPDEDGHGGYRGGDKVEHEHEDDRDRED